MLNGAGSCSFPRRRAQADAALALCSLIWGATFVIVKDALADASVFAFLTARFALAALVLGIVFWRPLRKTARALLWPGVQIGCFMFGGYAFQTWGLEYTTPAKAAFITGSSVVLVPLLLYAAAGLGPRNHSVRRPGAGLWIGASASFAGLYFLAVPKQGLGALNRGDVLVFACAVMFAFHLIFVGKYAEKHAAGPLAFAQIAVTALLAAAILPIAGAAGLEAVRWRWSAGLAAALLITAIGATVIAFWLQVWAQRHTSASHTAILLSLEPVFAGLTSWVLRSERFAARGIAGAALVFTGILLAELGAEKAAIPESP